MTPAIRLRVWTLSEFTSILRLCSFNSNHMHLFFFDLFLKLSSKVFFNKFSISSFLFLKCHNSTHDCQPQETQNTLAQNQNKGTLLFFLNKTKKNNQTSSIASPLTLRPSVRSFSALKFLAMRADDAAFWPVAVARHHRASRQWILYESGVTASERCIMTP